MTRPPRWVIVSFMTRSGYLARKFVLAMVTILVVMVIDFMLSRVLLGGPVRTVIGRNVRIAPEAQLALREQFGLNKPIFPDQFPSTVGKWVRGSLGISLSLGRLVSEILLAKLGNTLLLIGLGQVLAIVFGVTLALVAGWKRQARSCEIRSIRIRRRCSQWCRYPFRDSDATGKSSKVKRRTPQTFRPGAAFILAARR